MQTPRKSFFTRPTRPTEATQKTTNSSLALAAFLVLVVGPIRIRADLSSEWIEVVRKFKANESTRQAVSVTPSLKLRGRSRLAVRVPGDGELPRCGRVRAMCGKPFCLWPVSKPIKPATSHVMSEPEEAHSIDTAVSKSGRDKCVHGPAAASHPT